MPPQGDRGSLAGKPALTERPATSSAGVNPPGAGDDVIEAVGEVGETD
jgi:hypothetical protein